MSDELEKKETPDTPDEPEEQSAPEAESTKPEAEGTSPSEGAEPSPEKKRLDKRVIIAIAAAALLIVIIVIVLLCANSGKKPDESSAAGGGSAASSSEAGGSADSSAGGASLAASEPESGGENAGSVPNSPDTSEAQEPSAPDDPTPPDNPDTPSTPDTPSVPDTPTPPDNAAGFTLSYSADNSWDSAGVIMYGLQLGITNNSGSAVSGWTLVAQVEGLQSCEGWNGTYSVSGSTLTITSAEYNGDIAQGGSISVGCNMGVTTPLKITSATLNGVPCTIKEGTVPNNPGNGGNNGGGNGGNGGDNNGGNNGGGNNGTPSADIAELLKRDENAVQGDDWLFTNGNKIVDKNGKEVWLTGVNWFGYNTGTNIFDGLWNSQLEPTIKAIADHGFNLIRVPISAELINQWASGVYPQANYNQAYNSTLNGMNSLQIFDYFLKLAEQNGLKVMPDIHSAETNASGHNVNLWYTDKISVEDYFSALEWLADRYKDNDTIIAIDLKNEPHGKPYEGKGAAIWNDSKDANNWKYIAEQAAARIFAKNPNVLVLVEGTEIYSKKNGSYSSTDEDDYYFNWWGGNLRGVKDYPVNLGKYQNKLVYSPHDYGPTVYEQPWFKGDYSYDSLMKDCWRDNWLYIHTDNIAPLLIGEWGGFMSQPNLKWMTYMRQLIATYHLNHTFWCLNANSGDTGGLLLDDFVTWDTEKYNFVKEVLWQENGKFVGLDHAIPLGVNGTHI